MITENLYFVIGPLRTGSSLMSRCLDDHPQAICLCESEINRALFPDYSLKLHFDRMTHHGLTPREMVALMNRRKQDSVASLLSWYHDSQNRFSELYGKQRIRAFGDKSPDFFTSPELIRYLAMNHRLLYTVRDPRAIYRSIIAQSDSHAQQKSERWQNLSRNFVAWEPWLEHENVLSVRYEDVVSSPQVTMNAVYAHLSLDPSMRFLEPFERKFPKRFLWTTAVDWKSGIRREFDESRIDRWKTELSGDDIGMITRDQTVSRFMKRFGYE